MPIKVEYGPSAVAVGELAYRTGQNEYIAKRRKEMEELAQRQAEMRQRSQAQQQSLQADLFKFHGQQQTAMQQLQQRQQQFQQQGQQFEQGQQQQVQLAEQGREHDLKLEKIHGEQKVADAKMRHGLATERDFNTFKRNAYSEMYKTKLNESGQLKLMELLKQREDLGNDTRVPPEEMERSQQELDTQIESLAEDPQFTIAADQQVGYEEGFGPVSGTMPQNTSHKRIRNAQGGWDVVANMDWVDETTQETTQLTQEEYEKFHRPESYENAAGEIKAPDTLNELTGLWNYKTVSTREQRDALEDQKRSAASAERQKLYGMYQADKQSYESIEQVAYNHSFNSWLTDVYQMPEGVEADEVRRMAEEEAAQRQREEEAAAQQQNAANLLQDAGLPPVEQAPPERGMPDNPFENAMEAAAVAKPGSRVHIRTPNGGTAEIIVHGR